MAPRKRRAVGRLKGPQAATPQTSLSNQAVNTRGFLALADEIYLEIISHIPSVPIPISIPSSELPSYPEIRRSRHETLLSLSQTSRSLRRFFRRYLWQRIEVREGMKIRDQDDTLADIPYLGSSDSWSDRPSLKKYTIELVRQLEIVTVRDPQLAQYVNYLDVFIGEYSIDTVLAELARCLSLFPNLHTVQIDVTLAPRRSLGKIFERTFKQYSYPQIRNVFVMFLSQSLIASCPEARHVGFTTQRWTLPLSCLHTMIDNCPLLEVLENLGELFWTADTCKLVVDNFPNLRTITMSPSVTVGHPFNINILKKLSHLQTIVLFWTPTLIHQMPWHLSAGERVALLDTIKEGWVETAKHFLMQIQLRDNLEKTLIIRSYEGELRKILIKPTEAVEA